MDVNERVMTIAASSPSGETRRIVAAAASGDAGRQVTAMTGWPAAAPRSASGDGLGGGTGPADDDERTRTRPVRRR